MYHSAAIYNFFKNLFDSLIYKCPMWPGVAVLPYLLCFAGAGSDTGSSLAEYKNLSRPNES